MKITFYISIFFFYGISLNAQTSDFVENSCSQLCADAKDPEACLCECMLSQANELRQAEVYDQAVAKLRAVQSLCPQKGAGQMIDSIFQNYRIWRFKDGKFALSTPLGKELTSYIFDNPQPFQYGKAIVEMDGKYYFLDKDGHLLNEGKGFDAIIPTEDDLYMCLRKTLNNSGEAGLIPKEAKQPVITRQFNSVASTGVGLFFQGKKNQGIFTNLLKLAKERNYINIKYLSNGRIRVQSDKGWGFVDINGNEIIPPKFLEVRDFSKRGKTAVKTKNGWGLIDSMGREIIKPQYKELLDWNWPYIIITTDQGEGVVDSTGRQIIEPIYSEIAIINGKIRFTTPDGRGLFNEDGKTIIPLQDQEIYPYQKNKFKIVKDGFESLTDENGAIIIPPKYEIINYLENGLILTSKGGSYGFLDSTGKELTPHKYTSYSYYNSNPNTVFVSTEDGMGVIDNKGKEIIKPQYSRIERSRYGENKIMFQTQEGWGFMDSSFQVIVNPQFERVLPFINNKAAVQTKTEKAWGWIDTTGAFIIPPQFIHVAFSSQFPAEVSTDSGWILIDSLGQSFTKAYLNIKNSKKPKYVVKTEAGWGWMNSSGKEIIPPRYDEVYSFIKGYSLAKKAGIWLIIDSLSNELPLVNKFLEETFYKGFPYRPVRNYRNPQLFYSFQTDKGLGIIDTTGKIWIHPQYEDIIPNDSLFLVKTPDGWGWINIYNEPVISPQYQDAFSFIKGRARVKTKKGWGIIDTLGNFILPDKYEEVQNEYNGMFSFKSTKGWGVLNANGKLVLPAQYFEPEIEVLYSGYTKFSKNGIWGLVDTIGNVVLKPEYERIVMPYNSNFIAIRNKKGWGIADKQGTILIPPKYEEIDFINEKYIEVRTKEGWGIIDHKENTVIPPKYLGINLWTNKVKVQTDKGWGVMDFSEQFIISPQYESIEKYDSNLYKIQKDSLFGLIDSTGKELLPPRYEYINNTGYGYTLVQEGDKYKRLDPKTWKEEISENPNDDRRSIFQDYSLEYKKDSTLILNASGKVMFSLEDYNIDRINHPNLALIIEKETGLRGLIDSTGKIILEARFERIYSKAQEEKYFNIRHKGLTGFIDTLGQEIVPPIIDTEREIINNFSLIKRGEKFGFFFRDEGIYIPPDFNDIALPDEMGYVAVRKGDKWGWIDKTGETIIPIHFDAVGTFDKSGLAWVYQHGMRFQINRKGEYIFPERYFYSSKISN